MEPLPLTELDDDAIAAKAAAVLVELDRPYTIRRHAFKTKVGVNSQFQPLWRELYGAIQFLRDANKSQSGGQTHSNALSAFVELQIHHARTRILVLLWKIMNSEGNDGFVEALQDTGFFHTLLAYLRNPDMCNMQAAAQLAKHLERIECTAVPKK